jgi:hypothetical protein
MKLEVRDVGVEVGAEGFWEIKDVGESLGDMPDLAVLGEDDW